MDSGHQPPEQLRCSLPSQWNFIGGMDTISPQDIIVTAPSNSASALPPSLLKNTKEPKGGGSRDCGRRGLESMWCVTRGVKGHPNHRSVLETTATQSWQLEPVCI